MDRRLVCELVSRRSLSHCLAFLPGLLCFGAVVAPRRLFMAGSLVLGERWSGRIPRGRRAWPPGWARHAVRRRVSRSVTAKDGGATVKAAESELAAVKERQKLGQLTPGERVKRSGSAYRSRPVIRSRLLRFRPVLATVVAPRSSVRPASDRWPETSPEALVKTRDAREMETEEKS